MSLDKHTNYKRLRSLRSYSLYVETGFPCKLAELDYLLKITAVFSTKIGLCTFLLNFKPSTSQQITNGNWNRIFKHLHHSWKIHTFKALPSQGLPDGTDPPHVMHSLRMVWSQNNLANLRHNIWGSSIPNGYRTAHSVLFNPPRIKTFVRTKCRCPPLFKYLTL